MHYLYRLILFLLVIFISACTTNTLPEDQPPTEPSDIDIIIGSADEIFNTAGDSLFTLDYTILELSRFSDVNQPNEPPAITDTLSVDVLYAGGEGGCPPHFFKLQWDGSFRESETGQPQINLGLAHFINSQVNCDALVQEELEINLDSLAGDSLSDDLIIQLTNLNDSTSVTFNPNQ